MPDYRRNRVLGGAYFFTVNLLDRDSDFLTANIGALRNAVRNTRARRRALSRQLEWQELIGWRMGRALKPQHASTPTSIGA